MDIKVKVSRKRKCPASLDWQKTLDGGYFIMSFGSLNRPENDVEIEFEESQLEELKKVIRDAQEKKDHSGWC